MKWSVAGGAAGGEPGSGEPKGHVGILGVGEDEVAAAGVGHDSGELEIERFLEGFHGGHANDFRRIIAAGVW
jgi:hypothetical protein